MSSSPRPELRRPSTWPLRTRLVAVITGVLAAASIVVGAATVWTLHKTLSDRIDSQLSAAASRAPQSFDDSHEPDDRVGDGGRGCANDPGHDGFPQGQVIGTLSARTCDGSVTSAEVLTEEGQVQPDLTATYPTVLDVPADGRPHTVDLGEQGTYRVIAETMPDGAVLITGLPLAETERTVWLVTAGVAGATVLVLVSVAVVAMVVVRRELRPLGRVAATAARVSGLRLDHGEVALPQRVPEADTDPRTEVGQVGGALNRMLDHVGEALEARHASETRLRRFVADAGHELRTPLAAIRGYAELSRRGPMSRDEQAHLLRRVESEAQRMSGLVEDLLLLARLDAGRPLDDEPVDLTALVVDALSDAHATGPGHDWRLEAAPEPVVVTGDAARLHQVVANLLANARTHTPERTVVTVRVEADDGDAVLRVADDGPGIPADLLPRVFERFARGDGSRSRTAGSTGLGLAIAQAVVIAHAGSVAVTSGAGRTEFTVRLPLAGERGGGK